MRVKREINLTDFHSIKEQLLHWADSFEQVVWLDSNAYPNNDNKYEAVLAVDADRIFQTDSNEALHELKEYRKSNKDWLFGYLSFDAGRAIGSSKENNRASDLLQFSKLSFFHPKKIFLLKKDSVEIHYSSNIHNEIEEDWKEISELVIEEIPLIYPDLKINVRLSKQEYFDKFEKIQTYIEQGEISEINFCQEFYAEASLENPLAVYRHLNEISKPPFAAYLRMNDKYVLCASPERYLSNTNGKLKTQPIKGTAKRKENVAEDELARKTLEADRKEILENTITTEMIVEELQAIAKKDSVQVTELCKVYSFKQVHQLISTIVCDLKPELHPVDAINGTYPMGSMTGIPKENSLVIIEELENFHRSLYSGSIGYFTPNDDFDFNVVIRSILYNAKNKYVSFSAGGAITALANPESEYKECLVKVKAMEEVLGSIVNK